MDNENSDASSNSHNGLIEPKERDLMAFEKAGYWMAVGVLALFASNHFAARHDGEVRCLVSRSLAAVQQASGHATRLLSVAEMMLGRGETRFARTQMTLACAQTRLASLQSVIAQHEDAMARVQAERARIVTMQQLHGIVICPRQSLRTTIPESSSIRTDGTI
jgi:hypothetical protein